MAMINLARERGLDGIDAELLCGHAGVDPTEFAREFDSVRDCAMQVYLANIAEFDRVVFEAVGAERDWLPRVRAAAYAALHYVAIRPLETRFDLLAMLEAGDEAQAHRDRYVRRIIDLIDEGRRQPEAPGSLGRGVAESAFGAVYRLLTRKAVEGVEVASFARFVPELIYMTVRPYIGEAAARAELTIPPPAPWSGPR